MTANRGNRSAGAHRTSAAAAPHRHGVVGYAVVVLSAGAAALVAWFMVQGGDPTRVTSGSAAGSNVLLITIDTLRADRVGAYGNRSGLTPALDQLAESGLRFDAAFTPVPMTLPAHASILTGLEPFSHGIRNNTGFRLGDTATLATMLKRAGYRTGAFVGAFVLSAKFGLNRDFDVYDDRFGRQGGGAGPPPTERRAQRVVEPAVNWILGGGSGDASSAIPARAPLADPRPWFAWLHLYDPHAPYQAPAEYASGRSPYDAEVAYADGMIARGLDTLRAAGQLDHTIVIAVADHGEGLGEHGEATHGLFAYDSTLRVPLIVSGPGIHRGVVRTPVATVDVAPTILRLLGIAVPSGLDGQSLLDENAGNRRARALYFEALDANLTRGWAPLTGVRVDGWKFIDLPIPELYDVHDDPHESKNLAERDHERLRVLQVRLKDVAGAHTASEAARPVNDADTRRRLASLGYIGTIDATTKRAFSADDDPKNLVGLNEAFYAAINEEQRGRYDSALATLRDVLAKRPDFLAARITTAALLETHGQAADAIALLQSAPGASSSAAAQTELGLAYEAVGKLNEAARCLERAAELRDGDSETLSSLGVVYARLHRFDDGRRMFRTILGSDPHSPQVWNNLGMLELSARNRRAAVDAFRHAVTADSNFAAAWRGLGAALVATDAAAAIDAWERAVALVPGDLDTLFDLGTVLADGPQPSRALPYLKQFVAQAPRNRYGREIARAAALIERIDLH